MTDRPRILVAGSGLAGLTCAATLGDRAAVTIFERLPVAGGEDWEMPRIVELVAAARDAGARVAAGTQAIRWEGDRLLAIGQGGGLFPAEALVVATGHRPGTRAELRIGGSRCGGVVPATVALHLLGHGVTLGRRVVIAGGGGWARDVAALALERGAGCTVVAEDVEHALPASVVHTGARVVRTIGRPRIQAVEIEARGQRERVACDALVLAEGRIPYRNVDGAVLDSPGVAFAQPGGAGDAAAVEAAGRAAAEQALEIAARNRGQHTPTTLRIGGPR